MKPTVIIFIFFTLSFNGYSQNSNFSDLLSDIHFSDTLIVQIDSTVFSKINYKFKNCKIVEPEFYDLFRGYSGYKNIRFNKHYCHSFKKLDNGAFVMTIIAPGKYNPKLILLTFKDKRVISELLLESSFVDAGQVDIYNTQRLGESSFARSYITEWEM